MYLQILVAVILMFTAVNCQVPNNFNEDEKILTICIENNLENLKKLRGSEFVRTFAKFAAKELTGKVNVKAILVENIVESFRSEPHNFPSTSTGEFWNDEIEDALRNALVHCVYDKVCLHTSGRGKPPNDKSLLTNQKYFRLLNLLLSFWEIPPRVMLTTPEGFRILEGYVDNFSSALYHAYALTRDTNELRVRIRNAWEWRVKKETNHLMRKKCPLFEYRYFLRDGMVYTCDCVEESANYNKWVTTEELTSVLRLFQSHPQNGRDDDVYNYMHERMRGYEVIFERRAISNYRIAFFFMELRVRGILTDSSVIDQSFIDELPDDLLDILDNDDAYISYLKGLREFLLGVVKLRSHLEEDMILYLYSEANERNPRPGRYVGDLSSFYTKGLYVENMVKKLHNDVAINGLVANFTEDKESLILCIESNLEDLMRLRGAEFVHSFATFAATELSGRSANESVIESVVKAFKSKPHNFPSSSTGEFWNKDLESALIHCVKDKTCLYCINSGKTPRNQDSLTKLQYIRLVELSLSSWPIPSRVMVRNSAGIITMAGYSDNLARAIYRAYSLTRDTNELRMRTRRAWQWRVYRETRHRSRCPLFIYRYNNQNGNVYTCGCAEDSNNYDRRMAKEDVSSVLHLFQSHPQNGREDNLYDHYENDGMRGYELFYERLSIPNYRIAFFIFELRVRNILTDQTVINLAFIDALPEDLLAILDDDDAYIAYITNLREFMVENVHLENPMEEDMIQYLVEEAERINPRLRYFGSFRIYQRGLYVEYIFKKFYNGTYPTTTTTTTTLRPTSDKPFYKRIKGYFSGISLNDCFRGGSPVDGFGDLFSDCFSDFGGCDCDAVDSCLKQNSKNSDCNAYCSPRQAQGETLKIEKGGVDFGTKNAVMFLAETLGLFAMSSRFCPELVL